MPVLTHAVRVRSGAMRVRSRASLLASDNPTD
jgi:hypothetical protein